MSTNYNMGDRLPLATGPNAPIDSLSVATFGDSTSDPGTIRPTATTDQEFCTVPIPATATTTVVAQFVDKWNLQLYYPAARLVASGGIGGQNTSQMIAREAAAPSDIRRAISDVMAKNPQLVLLRGGSINDISGFTPATPQATIDGVFDRHIQILQTLVTAGARVLDGGFYGFSANPSTGLPNAVNTSFVQATIVALNARIRAAVEELGPDKARWLELSGITHDGTGAYKPGISGDGTHLSGYGATMQAAAEAKVLTEWFGRSSAQLYRGPNLLNTSAGSLALFPTLGAPGAIGQTPLGFGTGRSNGVATGSTVEMRNGRRWWTVIFTPNNSALSQMTFTLLGGAGGVGVHAGATYPVPIVAGNKYGFELDFFMETLDGMPLNSAIEYQSRIDLRNAAGGRLVYDRAPNGVYTQAGAVDAPSRIAGHLAFSPIQISESSASLTSASLWTFVVNFTTTQALRIGIANPTVALVP